MFSKLGLFRFVTGYGDAIGSLRTALAVSSEVGDSLILLPEAFNIGKYYRDAGRCNYHPAIRSDLQAVAETFSVSFVAGLVIEEPNGPNPPFGSAYWIDRSGWTLICFKHKPDGYPNSTPCNEGFDVNNPLSRNEACIGALICMDCDDGTRERALATRFSASNGDQKIVCIPACMNKVYGAEAIARSWPDHYVILANSDPHGCRSFISRNGMIVKDDDRQPGNRIIAWTVG